MSVKNLSIVQIVCPICVCHSQKCIWSIIAIDHLSSHLTITHRQNLFFQKTKFILIHGFAGKVKNWETDNNLSLSQ